MSALSPTLLSNFLPTSSSAGANQYIARLCLACQGHQKTNLPFIPFSLWRNRPCQRGNIAQISDYGIAIRPVACLIKRLYKAIKAMNLYKVHIFILFIISMHLLLLRSTFQQVMIEVDFHVLNLPPFLPLQRDRLGAKRLLPQYQVSWPSSAQKAFEEQGLYTGG